MERSTRAALAAVIFGLALGMTGAGASDESREWDESGGVLKSAKDGTTSCEGIAPLETTCTFDFTPGAAGIYPLVMEADVAFSGTMSVRVFQGDNEASYTCAVAVYAGTLTPLGAPCDVPSQRPFRLAPITFEATISGAGKWLAGVYYCGRTCPEEPGGFQPAIPIDGP